MRLSRDGVSRRDHPVLLAAVFLVAYVALAAWAKEFAVTADAKLSIWYPPPGVVLVVLHVRGLRFWPVAIVGELISGLWVYDVASDFGLPRLILNAVAVTGAYALGAQILRWGRVDVDFTRRRHLALFIIAAFLVASPLAGLAGVGMQRWAGFDLDDTFVRGVVKWWVGDAIGMLVLAPLGYAMLRTQRPVASWARRMAGRIGWFELVEAAAVIAFPVWIFSVADDPYRVLYVPLLPVALVAVRHGAGPAAWAVLGAVLATTIAASTSEGGTIGRTDLQLLLLVLGITGSAIGSLERLRRLTYARALELRALIEASPDLVAIVEESGAVAWVNPAGRRLLAPSGSDETPVTLDRSLDGGAVAAALETGSWRGSAQLPRAPGDGSDDDVRLSQLVVALPGEHARRVGVVARDVSDLHRVTDQLTRLAFVDELTGLANRARLFERLAFALSRTEPGTGSHGLVLVDLDRFAALNDHRGHDVGDAVLRGVAERLGEVVRSGELLARVGDDRFVVLLEDIADDYAAVTVAERLRLAAGCPASPTTGGAVVTASAAVVIGSSGDDPDVVLRRADLALQRAKQAGGATTTAYDATLSEQLAERIRIEALLRDALAGPGWPLRYQPLLDLATGAVVSCEALLEPLAPPLTVVEVAEELGLIGRLGDRVLAAAVDQAVRWRRHVPALRMGVNMSAHQLVDPQLPARVEAELLRSGLPGDALVLEITETAFTDDHPQAAAAASVLQGMGVRISIDDFGTGFSSLGRLRSLPADELKLDRTFVADLGRFPGAEAIVAAVVALGAARGLHVVAEGVEEQSQCDALRDLGCQLGQGWLFARPMAPDDFERWLADRSAARSIR